MDVISASPVRADVEMLTPRGLPFNFVADDSEPPMALRTPSNSVAFMSPAPRSQLRTPSNSVAFMSPNTPAVPVMAPIPLSPIPIEMDAPWSSLLLSLQEPQIKADSAHTLLSQLHDTVSSLEEEKLGAFVRSGGALTVLSAMQQFKDSEQVLLQGFGIVTVAATTTSGNDIFMVEHGALELCAAALSTFTASPLLIELICTCLRMLLQNDVHKALFGGDARVQQLVQSLSSHGSQSPNLVVQCAAVIGLLALVDDNKSRLASYSAIPQLIAAMRQHSLNASVQQECCTAVRNLCVNHGDNKAAAAEANGLEVILHMLSVHAENSLVQLHVTGAIWAASANNQQNKLKVVQLGVLDHLLTALQQHATDTELCCEVMGTLRNLSTAVENKDAMMKKQVIPAVIRCMQAYRDTAHVQEQGCALLFNMADDDRRADTVVGCGAVEVALAALQAHLHSDMNVVEESLGCLWMFTRSAAALAHANASLILTLADTAMRMYTASASIQEFGNGAAMAWSVDSNSASRSNSESQSQS